MTNEPDKPRPLVVGFDRGEEWEVVCEAAVSENGTIIIHHMTDRYVGASIPHHHTPQCPPEGCTKDNCRCW